MTTRAAQTHDLVIKNGIVVTTTDRTSCDVGISDGKIAELGEGLTGHRTIEARGKLVLPGGIDSHCHIEQLLEGGQGIEDSVDHRKELAFIIDELKTPRA